MDVVASRVASIPPLVEALVRHPPPLPSLVAREVIVTGIGAAAGPARYLAALLRTARYVPVSAFANGELESGSTLVLFSQHLSPNARLVLANAGAAARVVVVTSAHEDDVRGAGGARVESVRLPPEDERGMLLRVTGPAVAMAAAALLAREAGAPIDPAALARVPDVLSRALETHFSGDLVTAALEGPLAVVTAGEHGVARAIAWKLLEGWSVPEPPTWDVLEIAHGPFQQLYARPACLVVTTTRASEALASRLASMLVPERHALVLLASDLPPSLAPIEHDALANQLLLAGLRARPRDLFAWDGQGLDRPLYDLGA